MTTTTPSKTPYTCRAPSLAHSVISFFVSNQDEALNAQDLITKWGAKPASISVLLSAARGCGAITHNGGLYMLGDIEIARQCIELPSAVELPATAPAPAAVPTTARSLDDVTGEEWNAASAAARAIKKSADAPENQPITVHGIGDLVISYELLASRVPAAGRKWDPVMEKLASMPIDIKTRTRPTIRITRELAGAARAGAASWTKRNLDRHVCIRVISVGTDAFIQRIS